MAESSFDTMLRHLRGDHPPRVWSLLVTVFGELAQAPDAQISGAIIHQLTGLIDIKPEATRVALHRLRKDGWITSHRVGRTSSYALTDWGRAQSAAASPVIYASTNTATQAWLIASDPVAPFPAYNSTKVTTNIAITAQKPEMAQAFVSQITPETQLPDWIKDKLCQPALGAQSSNLARYLGQIQTTVRERPSLTTAQKAALRVLIVHSWRRIVLKVPKLPDFVFPHHWKGDECRKLVHDLLSHLPKPTLAELEVVIA